MKDPKTENVPPSFWDKFDAQLQEFFGNAVQELAPPRRLVPYKTVLPSTNDLKYVVGQLQSARESWRPLVSTVLRVDRDAGEMLTIVVVQLVCGHKARFVVDECNLVLLNTGEIVDYFFRVLEGEPERHCYCVVQEHHKPCCARGECQVGNGSR